MGLDPKAEGPDPCPGSTDLSTDPGETREARRAGRMPKRATVAIAAITGVADGGALAAAIGTGLLYREEALLHANLTVSGAGTASFRR